MPEADGAQAAPESGSWLSRLRDMPNDTIVKTVTVAVLLCLVCSIVVSATAVMLRPLQQANRELDMQRNILRVAGLLQEGTDVAKAFERVETRIVDLATGEYTEQIEPSTYDQRQAAKDPELSIQIPPLEDIAKIRRRAKYAKVYLVREGEQVDKIVLPMHGAGLWSRLYGFLALQADGNTIYRIGFYEHAETPGLGGEIDNPDWQALWEGRKLFDDTGDVALEVIKGHVDPGHPEAVHQVDGLAGATLTARGVNNLVRYWVSDEGFGPYLAKIHAERG